MAGMYRSRIPAAKDAGPSVDDLVLQRAYQNLTQDMQRGQGRKSGGGASNGGAATGCSQESLLASFMQKVVALEAENAALKQQLAAATSCAFPRQEETPSPAAGPEAVAASTPAATGGDTAGAAVTPAAAAVQPGCQECKQAWQVVEEMKRFLADYGLTWVGDAATSSAQPSSSDTPSTAAAAGDSASPAAGAPTHGNAPSSSANSSSSSSRGLPFDLQDLQACIQDLNELVHAGEASIAPVSGPASSSAWRQLQVQEPVPLLVFRDGLQLGTSPMRSYEDATANAILCDLFEGYFPGVLKKQYPEGTPLQLVDCSHMTMREAAAKGPGATSSGRKLTSFSELGLAVPVAHLQQGDLLARLPAHVIQDGRVVPVRGAVADYIGSSRLAAEGGGGQPQGVTRRSSGMQYTVLSRRSSADDSDEVTSCSMDAPGPYRQEQQQPQQQEEEGEVVEPAGVAAAAGGAGATTDSTDGQVATLQVRSEDGKQAFILKLKYTDTIGRVKQCIDKHRAAQQQQQQQQPQQQQPPQQLPVGSSYELRSAFPARVHTDDSMTLQEAQLVPNATLYMRAA